MSTSDAAARASAAFEAYVTGEGSVSTLWSGLKGVPTETVRAVLAERRAAFEAINPARAVLLDSFVGPTR